MRFHFDIDKCVAAAAYVADRAGGTISPFELIKTLYLADRESFLKFHASITGDRLVSLPKGPVLSRVYDFVKGVSTAEGFDAWEKVFTPRENNKIRLKQMPELGYLSARDRDILDAACGEIAKVKLIKPLSDWSHEVFPEWTDPHGSMTPIDPAVILRNAGKTEGEIASVEEELEALNFVRAAFG